MTRRLLLIFLPVVLVSLGLAWIITPFVPYPYFRVFNRCLYVLGFFAILFFQRRIRKKSFLDLGLGGRGKALSDISAGVLLSLVFFTAVTLFSLYAGFSELHYHPPLARKLMNYVLGSILIAFFEEVVFRGLFLQTLMDDFSTTVSVLVSSAIYVLVHFVRPLLTQPEDLSQFPMESAGLFLFGLLLCYAFLRTGSLYLSMGLHGGFVLLLKLDGIVVDRLMHPPVWLFGEERLVGGVVTWLGLLLIFPLIYWLTRKRHPSRIRVSF